MDKAINSLRENGKAEDLVGALRDLQNVPVWDGVKARFFDHLTEIQRHCGALANARKTIFNQMGRKEEILAQLMDDLKLYREQVIALLEKAR